MTFDASTFLSSSTRTLSCPYGHSGSSCERILRRRHPSSIRHPLPPTHASSLPVRPCLQGERNVKASQGPNGRKRKPQRNEDREKGLTYTPIQNNRKVKMFSCPTAIRIQIVLINESASILELVLLPVTAATLVAVGGADVGACGEGPPGAAAATADPRDCGTNRFKLARPVLDLLLLDTTLIAITHSAFTTAVPKYATKPH